MSTPRPQMSKAPAQELQPVGSPSTDWFEKLPIECRKEIASHLETDFDICSFRSINRATHDAIDADCCSFWRSRFKEIFETPAWKLTGKRLEDNEMFRDEYKKRRQILKLGAKFKMGNGKKERQCLEVLRDLIIDANSDKDMDAYNNDYSYSYASKNIGLIRRFVESTNVLKVVCRSSHKDKNAVFDPLYLTIQVLLAPILLSFNPHIRNNHYGFENTQQVVYATAKARPIFGGFSGLEIDMDWVINNINFWKHHMTRTEECTLHRAFDSLGEFERPQFWEEPLSQKSKTLGKYWKGSYTFVEREEIQSLRAGDNDKPVPDIMNGESEDKAFQDLRLELVENQHNVYWPPTFEKHLKSLVPPSGNRARTRAQKASASADEVRDLSSSSFRFEGDGHDQYEDFLAAGWLNPLPPQHGVPGWRRMTMMKYFVDAHGSVDEEALWAYEGIVLPGAQMMLGRWWSPADGTGDRMYSGPFILWCVDASIEDEDTELNDE